MRKNTHYARFLQSLSFLRNVFKTNEKITEKIACFSSFDSWDKSAPQSLPFARQHQNSPTEKCNINHMNFPVDHIPQSSKISYQYLPVQ